MDDLVDGIGAGDRRALARLISRVEDGTPEGRRELAELFPRTGNAYVTGITGAPGGGKSTLTDHLVTEARAAGEVAVVAVDPTSPFSGGAILGDRVRMQQHIDDRGVYIRSLASRGQLGGLSAATPKVVAVLDAVGFGEILVETVGVGQAEVEIAANADTTVVVVNPGWGDSVQAAKAGLLEIGDVFVVNKAERPGADEAVRDLQQMLQLGAETSWQAPIVKTTAVDGTGVGEVWAAIGNHRRHLEETSDLEAKRRRRLAVELDSAIAEEIRLRIGAVDDGGRYADVLEAVLHRTLDPWTAATRLLA